MKHTGAEQHGCGIKQCRAADATRPGAADHVHREIAAGAQRDAIDCAGRGPHAVTDVSALEGWAGRCGSSDHAIAIAQHDFAIRAEVDQQRHPRILVHACGDDRRHGVAAYVAADHREDAQDGLGTDVDADLGSRETAAGGPRAHVWRLGERGRVDAKQRVQHHGVAGSARAPNIFTRGVRLLQQV